MSSELIEQLARLRGIGDAYYDHRGELRYFSLQTKTGLLRAMGCDVENARALEEQIRSIHAERSRALLPALAIARGPMLGLDINVSAREFGSTLIWRLRCEDGSQHQGAVPTTELAELSRFEFDGSWVTRRRFELPVQLPPGTHELEASAAGGELCRCALIVAPRQCFLPPALCSGRRLWGVSVQLYTLRSRRNWGMGDFDDLKALVRWLAARGGAFVALNPLHALAPSEPDRASPYSASNRGFLNILYIAIESIPEFADCAAAQQRVAAYDFEARLIALRALDYVDYRGVAALKLELLRLLYAHFRDRHVQRGSERAATFRAFVAAGGNALQKHAIFDALDAHFSRGKAAGSGWQNWPAEFADADGAPVGEFARGHADEVGFYLYAQWLAFEQLGAAQALARELNMPIGLYGDFAVGAHPSGSEVWSQQDVFRLGAEVGAPPDPLALKGQGWGVPPQDPRSLQLRGLKPITRVLENNMRHFGALRLDHVMALFRLWWVPAGQSPAEGAYVHYPIHELMTALTLLSNRHQCLIVGEDLGTVPDEIRAAMPDYRLLHYKVLLFEKSGGRFRRPDEFERDALAIATTHDMPPLASYWEGRDIELRDRLHLYPDEQMRDQVIREREQDKTALLAALGAADLLPELPRRTADAYSPALGASIHAYLARSAALLAAFQIEDLLGMFDPVNVPGTHWEFPNWQRKLSIGIEEIDARADIDAVLAGVNRVRQA